MNVRPAQPGAEQRPGLIARLAMAGLAYLATAFLGILAQAPRRPR